jgi:hypothetical protein
MIIYRFAAAVALLLELSHHCGIHLPAVPIGGSALAQLGAIFGVAFVLTEGQVSVQRFGRAFRHGICRVVRWARALVVDLVAAILGRDP